MVKDKLLTALKKIRQKKIIWISALLIVCLVVGIIFYLRIKYPTTSPFSSANYFVEDYYHPHATMSKEIIGFLPYWTLDNAQYVRFDLVSDIIFFSLTADENGHIVKVTNGETDPGWRWWNSQTVKNLIAKTQITGGKFSLTVAMQKNSTLEKFLDNPQAQQTLIDNLLKEIQEKHLNGINIDFEYAGTPDDGYREKFTEFNQMLTSQIHRQSPMTELSIDFFPLSIRKPRLFDIAKLTSMYDKIIVMSYDFYTANSDIAGPIAPMNGFAQGKYIFDVTTAFQDYLQVVPKEKLVMGVPYYGYDWPVEDGKTPQSKTLPQNDQNGYPAVISYGRMRQFNLLKPENCQWSDLAQESWCWYQDPETKVDHQVWFEDDKSINIKYDFAKDKGLAGIAIWTLGYDKNYPDLWNMIDSKFTIQLK